MRASQQDVREKEQMIVEAERKAGGNDQDVLVALVSNRVSRWKAVVSSMQVPSRLATWVAEMTEKHKSDKVRIWCNEVDWLTGLLIARYGESEHFWPTEFSDSDVVRARSWRDGDFPEGAVWAIKREKDLS